MDRFVSYIVQNIYNWIDWVGDSFLTFYVVENEEYLKYSKVAAISRYNKISMNRLILIKETKEIEKEMYFMSKKLLDNKNELIKKINNHQNEMKNILVVYNKIGSKENKYDINQLPDYINDYDIKYLLSIPDEYVLHIVLFQS